MDLGELVKVAEEYAPEDWPDFRIVIEGYGGLLPFATGNVRAVFDVGKGEVRIEQVPDRDE